MLNKQFWGKILSQMFQITPAGEIYHFLLMLINIKPVIFISFMQVLKIVNPDIQCGSQPGMAVRLPQVIKMLKQEVDYHLPPEKEIRRQVNNGYGVSTDTAIKRSKKNCKAERCVLIHLRAIDKQHREIILQGTLIKFIYKGCLGLSKLNGYIKKTFISFFMLN